MNEALGGTEREGGEVVKTNVAGLAASFHRNSFHLFISLSFYCEGGFFPFYRV